MYPAGHGAQLNDVSGRYDPTEHGAVLLLEAYTVQDWPAGQMLQEVDPGDA